MHLFLVELPLTRERVYSRFRQVSCIDSFIIPNPLVFLRLHDSSLDIIEKDDGGLCCLTSNIQLPITGLMG